MTCVSRRTRQSNLQDLRCWGVVVTRTDDGSRVKDYGKRFFPSSRGTSSPTKILSRYFICSTRTIVYKMSRSFASVVVVSVTLSHTEYLLFISPYFNI